MTKDIRDATVGAARRATTPEPRDPRPYLRGANKLALVAVYWWDSFGVSNEWEPASEKEPSVGACTSVGYVVHYTQHVISLAPNLCMPVPAAPGEEQQILGLINIPTAAIYRIDQLATAYAYEGKPTDD